MFLCEGAPSPTSTSRARARPTRSLHLWRISRPVTGHVRKPDATGSRAGQDSSPRRARRALFDRAHCRTCPAAATPEGKGPRDATSERDRALAADLGLNPGARPRNPGARPRTRPRSGTAQAAQPRNETASRSTPERNRSTPVLTRRWSCPRRSPRAGDTRTTPTRRGDDTSMTTRAAAPDTLDRDERVAQRGRGPGRHGDRVQRRRGEFEAPPGAQAVEFETARLVRLNDRAAVPAQNAPTELVGTPPARRERIE